MTKAAVKDIEGAYDRYLAGIKAVRERGTNIEKTADKGGAKFSIRKTQKMGYADQLKQIEKRILNGSNSLYVGIPSDSLQKIGITNAPFVMNQADYRKARRKSGNNKHYSSHSVPYDFFESMPDRLSDIGMAIDNGNKVTLVTDYLMDDTNGNEAFVIAGFWQNQPMESDTVNQIKSVYPLDDTVLRIKDAAEKGKLVVIDKKKAANMLATIGVQPSEVSRILNLAQDSLSQLADNVKRQSRSDADYLSAVERGDMNTAQRMVDEAAERAFAKEGRTGYDEIIKSAVEDNRVIDYDKSKRADLSEVAQTTSLGSITESSLEHNLSQFKKEINSFREKNIISYQSRSDADYLSAVKRAFSHKQ